MRIVFRILLGFVLFIVAAAVFMYLRAGSQRRAEADYHQALPKTIKLETGQLMSDSSLSQQCACKTGERSPDLYWSNNPPNVTSYALTMIDPDVPTPAFPLFNLTHWVVYDIPANFHSLPDGMLVEQAIRHTAQFGKNSMGELKYVGPCPPSGKHAYIFKIYALDTRIDSAKPLEKAELLDAMKGHVLAYGELKVYYEADRK